MLLPEGLVALLLLQLTTTPAATAEPSWPHNVPAHLKYFPEDEAHVRRSLSVQERLLRGERPIGVRKMSEDEGEMFFLDHWIFEGDSLENVGSKNINPTQQQKENSSITPFSEPLRPLAERSILDSMGKFAARNALLKRDFKCPAGTNDCASIGAPNSCCGVGSLCINIKDTGFGSVACCANGQECVGTISCDEESGYSSCPDSPNGGCCLPGYNCQDVGCIAVGTSVTYIQPSTSSPPPSSTSPPPSTTTPYTCSTGWFSCPASLGGGCCQTGRLCQTGISCLATDSSSSSSSTSKPSSSGTPSSLVAPVRPTGADSSAKPSTTVPSQTGAPLCPQGFYVCSAFYPNGCCRVGRDCQTTGSCVPTSSETIVATNGVTVVAPTGAGFATTAEKQAGTCPTGWYSCAANVGGNCCPTGYKCGDMCTATAGSSQVSDKVSPSAASSVSSVAVWIAVVSGIGAGVAMLVF